MVEKEMASFTSVNVKNFMMLKPGRKLWLSLFVFSDKPTIPTNLPNQIKKQVSTSLINDFEEFNVDVIMSNN